ncbi:Expansin-A23 [Zea mays]|uniref:Expansin n=1 Tax=Zea mays TaxID=4577 RepID=A0A3L6D8P5_MAIZE|nr:Expansin-A23 [Zea mays]
MDTSASSSSSSFAAALLLLLLPALSSAGDDWQQGQDAHATFYGDETGAETMQGACGYGDLFQQGYGLETTALSVALFNEGWSCGGCYEVRCQGSAYCASGSAVTVTATNLCPANYSKPSGNWCNPPQRHFDLSKPMFLRLVTDFRVGIVPVRYRRVACGGRRGGVRFEMRGNRWWVAVLVFNVAGAGEVRAVAARRDDDDSGGARQGQYYWADMARSWGQVWTTGDGSWSVGQGLSFRVVAGDGRALVIDGAVPPGWAFGQSFEGKGQF